jgi:hypothetical protein
VQGNFLNMASVIMAGGQLFMLAYSSITILNAVVKYLVLGKNQSTAQWGSLALVTVGLMVSGRAAQSLGNQVFLGVLCGCAACRRSHLYARGRRCRLTTVCRLLGALIFSFIYVLSEAVLSKSKDNPTPPQKEALCVWIGLVNGLVISLWLLIRTVARGKWGETVVSHVEAKQGDVQTMVLVALGFSLNVWAHQLSFFQVSGPLRAFWRPF